MLEDIRKSTDEMFNNPIMFTSIANVKMSSRLRHILEANDIYTLEAASRIGMNFMGFRNAGSAAYNELVRILEEHGLVE